MKLKTQSILNKVYNKDARTILEILPLDTKITTTITSPPYFDMKDYGSDNQIGFGQTYEDYLNDLKQIFSSIHDITNDDGSLWIVIDSFKRDNQVITLPFDLSGKLKEVGWLLQDIIIWKKDKTVPWSTKGFVQRKFEYILFFTKTNNYKYNKDKVRNFDTDQLKKWWVKYPERYNPKGKALDEIWEFPIPVQGSWGDKYIRHFCPLPKEMVATMIEISSDTGDVILDPFAGSGSVLFQSAVMKRNYVGFELNEDFIKMFSEYLKRNLKDARSQYLSLEKLGSQENFRNTILNLRALKYGRLLTNALESEFKLQFKVIVEIKDFLTEANTHMVVQYKIITEELIDKALLVEAILLSKKAPLSKFGIKPIFIIGSKIDVNISNYYGYTKSNSYSFSSLSFESPKVKVISNIRVDLNENDYI